MKGTISNTAARILNDPQARNQLNLIMTGQTDKRTVTVDGKKYRVDKASESIAEVSVALQTPRMH